MLGPTKAFYVVGKRVGDCISVMGDVSRASDELRKIELKKREARKSQKIM